MGKEGIGMRSRTGHTGSKEFHKILENSRLHELDDHPMTAKEMEIDHKIINTLKAKDVIEAKGKERGGGRWINVWGPGSQYKHYMKKWGWA